MGQAPSGARGANWGNYSIINTEAAFVLNIARHVFSSKRQDPLLYEKWWAGKLASTTKNSQDLHLLLLIVMFFIKPSDWSIIILITDS